MYDYDMYHTAMNRFKHPIIDWVIENEDIPYNSASSSIPEYELSVDCSIHKKHPLGYDHELEKEFIRLISSFYEDDVYPITNFGAQSANFLALLTVSDKKSNIIVEDPTYLQIQKIAESIDIEVSALKFAEMTRDEGVLVSPGQYFTRTDRFEDHIRFTFVEVPDIIKTGLEKLSKVIDGCR